MQFALSTIIEPAWSLAEVTAAARDLGYGGFEVYLPRVGADGDPAEGTPLSERDLVKLACEQSGVRLTGLSVDVHLTGIAAEDIAATLALRRAIDLAARLRCEYVRFAGATIPARSSLPAAASVLADALQPLADYAGAADLMLLIQNSLSYRKATEMWRLIEQTDHPAIGVSWDALAAAEAGEGPAASVPILNSRIQQVILADARLTRSMFAADDDAPSEAPTLARLGDGDLQVAKLLDRLRGIGFGGWAVVAYPASQTLGTPTEVLGHALAQIQSWKPGVKKPTGQVKKPVAKTI